MITDIVTAESANLATDGRSGERGSSLEKPTTILVIVKRIDCNNGIASYLETLFVGLRALGDRIILVSGDVTTPAGTEARKEAISSSAEAWIVLSGFNPLRPSIKHLRKILSVAKQYNVEVISPQGLSALPVASVAGRILGKKIVANYHPSLEGKSYDGLVARLPLWRRASYVAVSRLFGANKYIAMSSETVTFFRDVCMIGLDRIHMQLLGIEDEYYRRPSLDERRDARARFGLSLSDIAIVLPGRLNMNKGHDIAAKAVRLLRKRRADIKLVCLFPGGGEQEKEIRLDVLRGPDDEGSFQFLGFVDQGTLRDTYWASDIVILPSRMEGFGMVVAEAMCCGAIPIRTPSGGCKDQIIDNVTGFTVGFNDPEGLASAIEKVLSLPNRASFSDSVSDFASRQFAKKVMIAGTASLYRAAKS